MADWVYAETGSIKLEFEVADISDVYFTQRACSPRFQD